MKYEIRKAPSIEQSVRKWRSIGAIGILLLVIGSGVGMYYEIESTRESNMLVSKMGYLAAGIGLVVTLYGSVWRHRG